MTRILWLILFVCVLGACGYRASGTGASWIGGDSRTLYLALFSNRTLEPLLENVLAEQIVAQLLSSGSVTLQQSRSRAELSLTGVVTGFSSRAIAYDANDRITEYEASMTCEVRLVRNHDNTILWQDQLSQTQTYLATLDKSQQLDGQDQAVGQVARRLAEDLVARLHNGF